MRRYSIKLRLSVALILATLSGIVLLRLCVNFFIIPGEEEITLSIFELISVLPLFFLLVLAIIFLCFPIIFHPITKAARVLKENYAKGDFTSLRPEHFPELKNLMNVATNLLKYAEKGKTLAELIKKVSSERAQLAETDRMTGLFNKSLSYELSQC